MPLSAVLLVSGTVRSSAFATRNNALLRSEWSVRVCAILSARPTSPDSVVDGLNHEEFFSNSGRVPTVTDGQIRGICFYHNMVFIEKASNREGSPIVRALEKVAVPSRLGGKATLVAPDAKVR
jgi:hypothetical protein